jgi:hypothetical protein
MLTVSGELPADALARFHWSLQDKAAVKVLGIDLERFLAANPASSVWNGSQPTPDSAGLYLVSATDMSGLHYRTRTGVGQPESETSHWEQGGKE